MFKYIYRPYPLLSLKHINRFKWFANPHSAITWCSNETSQWHFLYLYYPLLWWK